MDGQDDNDSTRNRRQSGTMKRATERKPMTDCPPCALLLTRYLTSEAELGDLTPGRLLLARESVAVAMIPTWEPLALIAVDYEILKANESIIAQARELWPQVPALILAERPSESLSELAEEHRAELLVGSREVVVDSLHERVEEEIAIRQGKILLAERAKTRWGLTDRQHDIVRLLCHRVARRALARRTDVCASAVEKHLARIFEAMNTQDTTGVIGCVLRLELQERVRAAAAEANLRSPATLEDIDEPSDDDSPPASEAR